MLAILRKNVNIHKRKLNRPDKRVPQFGAQIMELSPQELQEITTVEKPWGGFIQYVLNQPVTVKILEIRAGEQVSYQYHHHRSELWIPLDEGACLKLNGTLQRPKPMEPVFIPQGAKHQLIGESKDYRILEISFGHFDEEDIVRLSDKYGRIY